MFKEFKHRKDNKVKTVRMKDGQEYDMCGDYFQCSACDKFSIHKDQDKYCVNSNCSTNSRYGNCVKCNNKRTYMDQYVEYNGLCGQCYRRSKARDSIRTLNQQMHNNNGQSQFKRTHKFCNKCNMKYSMNQNFCARC